MAEQSAMQAAQSSQSTQTSQQVPQMQYSTNYVHPSQLQEAQQAMASLTKLLFEVSNTLIALRREFRGEALYQGEDGNSQWIQITKPVFIRMDYKTNMPIREEKTMPWGEKKLVYVANDEAIEEILSQLKFAGVNQITAIAGIDDDNYLDDLREFECKLAAALCLKQREWGIDKELLPMMQFKIKTIVQDARSLALEGRTLKALQTTVQRVEQMFEGDKTVRKQLGNTPY
jgi:hypothetical protein